MRCEEIIKKYLAQPDVYPSLLIRIHMMICPGCREEIKGLQKVFTVARLESPYRMTSDLVDNIMQRITISNVAYERNVSSARWLSAGVIILASILMVSYSDSFIWVRGRFGRDIEIPINIVLGFIITSYSASYIATHLENIKKVLDFIHHKMH